MSDEEEAALKDEQPSFRRSPLTPFVSSLTSCVSSAHVIRPVVQRFRVFASSQLYFRLLALPEPFTWRGAV
jgi:hypothetical protein